MRNQSIRRRTLLACGLTAGLVGIAGCLRKQRPEATHWAAGLQWSDPPGAVAAEVGFTPRETDLTGPVNPKEYLRVNGGEPTRLFTSTVGNSVPADRGDRVEYVIDFDTIRQGQETLLEYTIPNDDDLVGAMAGFAECLRYRGADEWILRPRNVDLDTDIFGRQMETLVVSVQRDRDGHDRDWYVWGHTDSIREALRDRAAESEAEFDAEIDVEFLGRDEEATFNQAGFYLLTMEITDGADRVAAVTFPESDDS